MLTVLMLSLSLFSLVLTVLPSNVSATTLYVGGVGPGNYTTIQDAINASFPGDTIFVYSGTYYERIVINRTITLIGEGPETTLIHGDGMASTVTVESDWVNLTGFSIKSGIAPSIDGGIFLFEVMNCSITNNNISESAGGIDIYYSDYNIISGNNLSSNYGFGIDLSLSHNNTIGGNLILSNTRGGIEFEQSRDNLVANNNISYHRYSGVDLATPSSRSNTVVNNIFNSNGIAAIQVEWTEDQLISGNTMIGNGILLYGTNDLRYWVSNIIDSSNTVNGRPVRFWKNSTGGVVPAGAGQVILANCTNVVVENQNLSSASMGVTMGLSSWNIIRNNVASDNYEGILLSFSHNNTLDANTVFNSYLGIDLWYGSDDNMITNNNLSYNDHTGLISNNFADNNTIEGNNMSSNGQNGIGLGLSKWNVITNNTFYSNQRYGINIEASSNVTISNNTIFANHEHGIYAGWSRDCVFNNNTVFSNDEYGIYASCSESVISNNTIFDNEDGLHVSPRDWNIISDNNIYSNRVNGLYLRYSSNNTIVRNTIKDNQFGAYVNSSYDNRIYHNHFINNTNQSVDSGINHWDNGYPSGGNYWSDYTGEDWYSGPDQNLTICDGIGDTPYDIPGGSSRDRYPLGFFCLPWPWHPINYSPTVNITSPVQGETISSEYLIEGVAFDPEGRLQIVEIKIDEGEWTEVTGNASWTFYWDTTNVSNGLHTIHVRSFDGVYYSIDVFVTVTVSNPISYGPDDWLFVAVAISLVVIAVIVMLAYILFKKRRIKGEEEPSEPPPEERIEEVADGDEDE